MQFDFEEELLKKTQCHVRSCVARGLELPAGEQPARLLAAGSDLMASPFPGLQYACSVQARVPGW
jgi:hypothetical protein